jgi:hypothetical protein
VSELHFANYAISTTFALLLLECGLAANRLASSTIILHEFAHVIEINRLQQGNCDLRKVVGLAPSGNSDAPMSELDFANYAISTNFAFCELCQIDHFCLFRAIPYQPFLYPSTQLPDQTEPTFPFKRCFCRSSFSSDATGHVSRRDVPGLAQKTDSNHGVVVTRAIIDVFFFCSTAPRIRMPGAARPEPYRTSRGSLG